MGKYQHALSDTENHLFLQGFHAICTEKLHGLRDYASTGHFFSKPYLESIRRYLPRHDFPFIITSVKMNTHPKSRLCL